MLYTSYFGNLRNLPCDCVTISICGKAPDWYTGLQYKKLAPKWNFFKIWKQTKDNDYYRREFNLQVLNQLDANACLYDLVHLLTPEQQKEYKKGKLNIVLLCYEKPFDFCHRHLVSNWFSCHGIECKEYSV